MSPAPVVDMGTGSLVLPALGARMSYHFALPHSFVTNTTAFFVSTDVLTPDKPDFNDR